MGNVIFDSPIVLDKIPAFFSSVPFMGSASSKVLHLKLVLRLVQINALGNNLFNNMDPRYTGEMLRHLDKQNELLTDAYRSMSNELYKLQVEKEMLMRKFFEFMIAQGLANKANEDNIIQADNDKGSSEEVADK